MTSTMIYITASSREEALRIGRHVVADRLAACANVLPGITSVYRWQGEVQEDGETALILKTRSGLVERLTARVKELHSYDCPCVVALPITGGNPDFLQWIAEETVHQQSAGSHLARSSRLRCRSFWWSLGLGTSAALYGSYRFRRCCLRKSIHFDTS